MIGMLDACLAGVKCWRTETSTTSSSAVVAVSGGEWYERVDREGNVVDSALGHGWKVNYHTVMGMIQVIRRLRKVVAA
jgi:hypothetical protein